MVLLIIQFLIQKLGKLTFSSFIYFFSPVIEDIKRTKFANFYGGEPVCFIIDFQI